MTALRRPLQSYQRFRGGDPLIFGFEGAEAGAAVYNWHFFDAGVPSGDMAGAVAGTSSVTGTLRGTGALVGAVAGTSSVTGAIQNAPSIGPLTGTVAGTAGVTGALTGTGRLVGLATGVSAVTATARGDGRLAGLATGVSSATGALGGRGALVGAATGASGAVGLLSGSGALSGAVAGTSSVTGAIADAGTPSGDMSGSVAAVSSVAGVLTNATPPVFDFARGGDDAAEHYRAEADKQAAAERAYEAERADRLAALRATLEAAAGLRDELAPETPEEALESVAEAVEPQAAREVVAELRASAIDAAAIARLEAIATRLVEIQARQAEDDDEAVLLLVI